MAFYCPDAVMGQRLEALVAAWEVQHPGLAAAVSITWLHYPRAAAVEGVASGRPALSVGSADRQGPALLGSAQGASWQGGVLRDPADLVALVFLKAVECWLQQDLLEEGQELRRAVEAMVRRRSAEATSLVVDLLSGTTSGPSLEPSRRSAWVRQRHLVTGWLASLGWPELEGCNVSQKLWQDGPYGRDRDLLDTLEGHGNRFSSEGLARLLEAVMAGSLVSPLACRRMRDLLQVAPPLPAEEEEGRPLLAGWIRQVVARGTRLWGMSSCSAQAWHQVVYGEAEQKDGFLLVLLCQGAVARTAAEPLQAIVSALLKSHDPAAAGS